MLKITINHSTVQTLFGLVCDVINNSYIPADIKTKAFNVANELSGKVNSRMNFKYASVWTQTANVGNEKKIIIEDHLFDSRIDLLAENQEHLAALLNNAYAIFGFVKSIRILGLTAGNQLESLFDKLKELQENGADQK